MTAQVQEPTPWGLRTARLLAMNPTSEEIVIGDWQQVIIWDVRKRSERLSCPLQEKSEYTQAAVSSEGTRLAAPDGDNIDLFDLKTGKRIAELTREKVPGRVAALAFSPNGKYLAAGINPRKNHPSYVIAWRLDEMAEPLAFRCHDDNLTTMLFFPETGDLATGSIDGTARVWDLDKLWPPPRKN